MSSSRITRSSSKKIAETEAQPAPSGQDASSSAQATSNPSTATPAPITTSHASNDLTPTANILVGTDPSQDGRNLALTNLEAATAEARRTLIRGHQAARYAQTVASGAEPDLNNPAEVRHFEVDSYGSITLIVFEDGGAVWRLREVEMDSDERGTMIVGRFYVVTRL